MIHRDNPYNPFGVDLSRQRQSRVAATARIGTAFDTYFGSFTLDGNFSSGSHNFFWDVSLDDGENRGVPTACRSTSSATRARNGTGSVTQETNAGSRTPTSPLAQRAPVAELSTEVIERSGLTDLGTTLQQLPSTGSAINARFNVPGNSGFPQDGNGIGAGAIILALRNLGAKRTLVLVDGKRGVPGASASGVPIAGGLNSLPANVIDRIEVLQDGASAIYGSDAIGSVANIVDDGCFSLTAHWQFRP